MTCDSESWPARSVHDDIEFDGAAISAGLFHHTVLGRQRRIQEGRAFRRPENARDVLEHVQVAFERELSLEGRLSGFFTPPRPEGA